MAVKLTLGHRLSQNLTMTPQLQQAIKLLTLTHLEMTEVIAQEMTENPLLEEIGGEQVIQEAVSSDNLGSNNVSEAVADDFDPPAAVAKDDFDWKSYLETHNAAGNYEPPNMAKAEYEDFPTHDNVQAKGPNLAEHLIGQLRILTLNSEEWDLAFKIIHNINDDGYLDIPFDEILANSSLSREHALGILRMIWQLDPVGCGTHNLTECLLAQLHNNGNYSRLLETIIQQYLSYVQKHDYQKLSQELGVSLYKIEEAVKALQQLHPRPGRLVAVDDTHYIVPDIYVVEVGGKFVVQINDEGVPRLRISQLYHSLLKSAEGSSLAGQEARSYIQEKLKAARWLIKSISNRQKTIYKVAEAIVAEQQEFFR